MASLSILLAPSHKKKAGGNPFAPDMFDYRSSNTFNYFSELNTERRALIDRLQGWLKKETHLPAPLERTECAEAMRTIYSAPLMSALDRYNPGVMYGAMDFPGLPTGAQRRLLENGLIFSGMFGLLRPDDLIPEYYVPMDLQVPDLGCLADYWRPVISPVLNTLLRGRLVWDFLPRSYRGAWKDEGSYEMRATVRFLDGEGEDLPEEAQSPLRGKLVNYLVRETTEHWEPVLAWKPPSGMRLREDLSALEEGSGTIVVVYTRR